MGESTLNYVKKGMKKKGRPKDRSAPWGRMSQGKSSRHPLQCILTGTGWLDRNSGAELRGQNLQSFT